MQWRALSLVLGTIILASRVAGAEMMSVNVPTANFRQGPSIRHEVFYSADRYYPIEVLERSDGWCKTKDFEGEVAWVAERLLGNEAGVVINVERANVRRGTSTRTDVLFRVIRGEALRVVRRDGEWLRVRDLDGNEGWLHDSVTWGLKPPAPEKKPAKE